MLSFAPGGPDLRIWVTLSGTVHLLRSNGDASRPQSKYPIEGWGPARRRPAGGGRERRSNVEDPHHSGPVLGCRVLFLRGFAAPCQAREGVEIAAVGPRDRPGLPCSRGLVLRVLSSPEVAITLNS